MNLAVFAYNFPHKKTQDFLWKLVSEGIRPTIVLAMNYVDLTIPQPTVRVKPKNIFLVHPQKICKELNLPYYVVDHNSIECINLLLSQKVDIGIIAGARILQQDIIDTVPKGIINFHPGLIPEVRGLDALQWAVYEGHPLGVTAHIIDKRVDAGRIIDKVIINEYFDDTLIDLSIRLYETQINMIPQTLENLDCNPIESFPLVGKSRLHRKMPPEIESKIPLILDQRLKKLQ